MSRFLSFLFAAALVVPAVAAPTAGSSPLEPVSPASPFEQSLQNAHLLGRPVLVYFQMQGCSWCRKFEAEVLSQDAVKRRLEAFEVITVDVIDEQPLALRHGVRGAPAFVVLPPGGTPPVRWTGFLDRDQFLKLLASASPAPEAGPSPGPGPDVLLTPPVITKLRQSGFAALSPDELAEFVTLGANPDTRPLADEILKGTESFPAADFLPLLRHPRLSVRLAALQILEERAGGTLGFDPWADPPSVNAEALVLWQAWAAGDHTPRPPSDDPGALAGHLNDLLHADPLRSRRGFRALLRTGPSAADAAARFTELNPSLPAGQHNRLRELRHAIMLQSLGVREPEALAHRLIFGNLDVRLQAMASIADLGPEAQTLLSDFLSSREPLEREAAVDGLLRAGGPSAVPTITAALRNESDTNVLHLALRKLGDTGGETTPGLLEGFVRHENEDLAIAALESLGRLKAASAAETVGAALKDPRWRVRVAALKAAADIPLPALAGNVKDLLSDPDEFVRISAVQTAGQLRIPGTDKIFHDLFASQDALKPAIIQSYSRMGRTIPDSFVEALKKSSPDVVLAVLGSVPDADSGTLPLLRWAAVHTNDDIACSALRLLSAEGLDGPANRDLVTKALRSGNTRRIETVLVSAKISRTDFAKVDPSANVVSLDRPASPPATATPSPYTELTRAVRAVKSDDPAGRIHTAILLTQLADPAGPAALPADIKSLATSQRVRLAAALSVQRTAATRRLFEHLLDDPEPEVRRAAITALFAEGSNASCLALAFGVLQTPGSHLRAAEVSNYRLTSRYSMNSAETDGYRDQYLAALKSSPDPEVQVLALDLLATVWTPACTAVVEPFLSSENPQVRRAAFFTLGRNLIQTRDIHRDRILNDTSPLVRAVLPALFVSGSFPWKVPYSETGFTSNYQSGLHDHRPRGSLASEDLAVLRQLAADLDPNVQLFANLALFTNLAPLDTARFASLVRHDPDARLLSSTLRNTFRQHAARMPDSYAALVSLVDVRGDEQVARAIAARFPASQPAASEPTPPPSTVIAAVPAATPDASDTKEVALYYFSKPGCGHCEQVKNMLDRVAESFPELRVTEFNINKNQSMELNETLSRRFGVPETLRLVAPAVFTASGFLVKDDIGEERLGDLILRSREAGLEPLAADPPSPAAAQAISERYARIHPGVILAAGVLDGLNPCAFATIIFLLSYLQIARKTPREMAGIGLAYVAGVFTAYFLLGLGLSEIVSRVVVFRQAAAALNIGMGLFALFIAALSFRDGVRCLQGRLGGISLQLPGFLKERIRSVIRKNVPHRGFVAAAFGVGALISLLELACTGQVYAPTILYMMQAGEGGAVGYLVLYNLAFILPLTVIFLLAFFGLTSGKLTAFLHRHAAAVKFGMALLFLTLAVLLLGREWRG